MARIDDRLIHGQVVLGCCEALHAARLVLLNDAVAEDRLQTRIYKSAVPPGIECEILGLESGAAYLRSCDDARPTVVVVGSPLDMATLLRLGTGFDEVFVGGLHRSEGRTQELDSTGVFVGKEDRQALASIRRAGVQVRVQSVPGAPAVDLDSLLQIEEP
jgi:mannose/fructose/N-acetylgalactosamine-specific phosphotransferase system component IIB